LIAEANVGLLEGPINGIQRGADLIEDAMEARADTRQIRHDYGSNNDAEKRIFD
jgi:hypothetical protein